jgi:hypothetical protein
MLIVDILEFSMKLSPYRPQYINHRLIYIVLPKHFWLTLFITWGPYAAFHGMARKCHIEGSMMTAV